MKEGCYNTTNQGCISLITYQLEFGCHLLRLCRRHTHTQAIPLAMITVRKSIHGFPLLSHIGMRLRPCGLLGCQSCAISLYCTYCILNGHAISKILMGRIISKKLYQYGMRNKSHLDFKLFHNKLSSPLYLISFQLFFVSSALIRMSMPSTRMHVVFFANTLYISLRELVHKEYEKIVFQK